jgi:hypothetical protein
MDGTLTREARGRVHWKLVCLECLDQTDTRNQGFVGPGCAGTLGVMRRRFFGEGPILVEDLWTNILWFRTK